MSVPIPVDPDTPWDFWEEAGLSCVSYNSDIDFDLYRVFCGVIEKKFNTDLASELKLPEQYVELLQSILCSVGWCDYGTSPRGCFVDHRHDPEELRGRLLDYLGRKWNMDADGRELVPPHPDYRDRD